MCTDEEAVTVHQCISLWISGNVLVTQSKRKLERAGFSFSAGVQMGVFCALFHLCHTLKKRERES